MYGNNNCSTRSYKIGSGNSVDLKVGTCESEIRADVTINEITSIRLWGRIVSCNGTPVPNALVKLVKVVYNCNEKKYIGIAHTLTDCEGFYQFELANCPQNECFKILVSKSAYGPERVLDASFQNCDTCAPQVDSCISPNMGGCSCQFDSCNEYRPSHRPNNNCY